MTVIHEQPHDPISRLIPHEAPPTASAILSDTDRRRLERHLQDCEIPREPLLSHVLRHKLEGPKMCGLETPRDAVAGGSVLEYRIDDEPARSGLLCHASRIGDRHGVIPVFSLLGATLIGMRVGQRAPLLREDGSISAVRVLDVTHPV